MDDWSFCYSLRMRYYMRLWICFWCSEEEKMRVSWKSPFIVFSKEPPSGIFFIMLKRIESILFPSSSTSIYSSSYPYQTYSGGCLLGSLTRIIKCWPFLATIAIFLPGSLILHLSFWKITPSYSYSMFIELMLMSCSLKDILKLIVCSSFSILL